MKIFCIEKKKLLKSSVYDIFKQSCCLKKNGFTLLELLTVISIIVILAGIVMPALGKARSRAFVAKTKSQMASLELALSMLESDCKGYPSTESDQKIPSVWFIGNVSSDGSITPPSGFSGWSGPYMEFKDKDLKDGFVIDAWGREFRYIRAGSHRPQSFEIYSDGLDGQPDTADDITNFQG